MADATSPAGTDGTEDSGASRRAFLGRATKLVCAAAGYKAVSLMPGLRTRTAHAECPECEDGFDCPEHECPEHEPCVEAFECPEHECPEHEPCGECHDQGCHDNVCVGCFGFGDPPPEPPSDPPGEPIA